AITDKISSTDRNTQARAPTLQLGREPKPASDLDLLRIEGNERSQLWPRKRIERAGEVPHIGALELNALIEDPLNEDRQTPLRSDPVEFEGVCFHRLQWQ